MPHDKQGRWFGSFYKVVTLETMNDWLMIPAVNKHNNKEAQTMSLSFDEMIGDTIAQVNVVREAFGYAPLYELPDARPGDTKDCLYFRALKDVGCVNVGTNKMEFKSERQAQAVADLWGVEATGRHVESPRGITRTISEFDGNHTSHYNV